MGTGRHVDDTGTVCGPQCGVQGESQLEVAEVERGEGPLVAAGVQDERAVGVARAVDQGMQGPSGLEVACGERVDRRRVEQVQPADLDALDARELRRSLFGVARGDHDRGACLAHRPRGLEPEATRAAGDDDVPACQIDSRQHVVGRRRGGERGADQVLLFSGHAFTLPLLVRTDNA